MAELLFSSWVSDYTLVCVKIKLCKEGTRKKIGQEKINTKHSRKWYIIYIALVTKKERKNIG